MSPKAKEIYAALATPGTEADVVARTGINPKTVGARIGERLVKKGLVEVVGKRRNEGGRMVNVYGRVPVERIEEARTRAQGPRVKDPRTRPLEMRKRIVRELLKDQDLVEALVADRAADRQAARARKLSREELRRRERQAAELRRAEKRAATAGDPLLPFWRAVREFTQGADAARILKLMLARDEQLTAAGGVPLVDDTHWADAIRHTADMLAVSGALHTSLHAALGVARAECPACGAEVATADGWTVVEGEFVEELAELVSGDD